MKVIIKVWKYIIGLVELFSAIITIIVAFNIDKDKNGIVFTTCIVVLIFITGVLYIQWLRANNILNALQVIVHRGRIHTVSYLVHLAFLENRFSTTYDNESKKSSLRIEDAEFSFHYRKGNGINKDIEYHHKLLLVGHNRMLDILIMHTPGELVRVPQEGLEYLKGVYLVYQGQTYSIMPEPSVPEVYNRKNQIFDRVRCQLPPRQEKKEWLDICYQTRGGGNLTDDNVFVIYPKNFGKNFSGKAVFKVFFDEPYFADIQLMKLAYNSLISAEMQPVMTFNCANNSMHYACQIKNIDNNSVYFVVIKHKDRL